MVTSRITSAIALTVALGITGPVRGEVTIPETPAGLVATAYLNAFNAGTDTAMQSFFEGNLAATSLRRRSVEDRINAARSRISDWGKLRIMGVIDGGPHGCLVAIQSVKTGDWYDLEFEVEENPPHKLTGIRIGGPLSAKRGSAGQKSIDEKIRTRVVERIADELIRAYVFEDVGRKMADDIRARLAKGEYDGINSVYGFANRLTNDLRNICHDRHLRIRSRIPRPRSGAGRNGPRRGGNYGFVKVEVLPGNVGYIKMSGFAPGTIGHPTAAAAMKFVHDTDALIFDLRENGGGSPDMIRFLSGYVFDSVVHLNSFHNRLEGISDTYSQEEIPGERYGQDKPVYILTSGYTFSAAEEFTYNLKHLKRATIVGETTGGGAHPVTGYTINKYFEMSVPFARAVNPVTKTNWEGVGVIPHIKVPADEALETAHQHALSLDESDAGDSAPSSPAS